MEPEIQQNLSGNEVVSVEISAILTAVEVAEILTTINPGSNALLKSVVLDFRNCNLVERSAYPAIGKLKMLLVSRKLSFCSVNISTKILSQFHTDGVVGLFGSKQATEFGNRWDPGVSGSLMLESLSLEVIKKVMSYCLSTSGVSATVGEVLTQGEPAISGPCLLVMIPFAGSGVRGGFRIWFTRDFLVKLHSMVSGSAVSEPNRESLEICEEIGSVFVTNYQKNMASTGLILQCSTPKILSGKPDLVKDPSNVRRASVSFGTPFGGLAVEVVVG